MTTGGRKTRGPRPGNQNATKHGFYSSVLLPSEEALLPRAKTIRGLNDEITVARIRIASVVSTVPTNPMVLSAAVHSLVRLERTRHSLLTRRRTADSRAAKLQKTTDRGRHPESSARLPTSSLPKGRIEGGLHRAAKLRKMVDHGQRCESTACLPTSSLPKGGIEQLS